MCSVLADSVSVPSFVNIATYSYSTDGAYPGDRNNQLGAFLAQGADQYEIENTVSEVTGLGNAAISSSNILQTVGSGYVSGGQYPAGSLGAGLLLIAQIINANVGARILYVTYGGFDNHANEDQDHDALVKTVSDAIKAFFDDLDGQGELATARLDVAAQLEVPAHVRHVELDHRRRPDLRRSVGSGLQGRRREGERRIPDWHL